MRVKIIFIVLAFVGITTACNKEDNFNYPEGTVGISKIVYFPSVSTKGDRLVIINQGEAFSDPGATALLNGQTIQYTTTGTVDASTPGVYGITYEAQSPQGYTSSDWRTVVVIGNDVTANDYSGTYLRTATGVTSTWTKIANGVYEVDNPGGAAVGVGYKVIVVNYTDSKIKIPRQLATDPSSGGTGEVSSRNETYSPNANPIKYSWVFLAGGYGTGLRTFFKQ
jgi:hypothetical protein